MAAQSTVGSYSNPLKKFKYIISILSLPNRWEVYEVAITDEKFRLVFLGEQSGILLHSKV